MKIYRIAAKYNIFLGKYEQSIKQRLDELAEADNDRFYYLKDFQFDFEDQMSILNNLEYPNVYNLRAAIQSKNVDRIRKSLSDIFRWEEQNENVDWSQIGHVVRSIHDYCDQMNGYQMQWTEFAIEKKIKELMAETMVNMQAIQKAISNAIGVIPNWNNSPINIEARPIDKDNDLGPETTATIEVVGGNGLGGEASFTVFSSEKGFVIDDVLESGDSDFFESDLVQSDYFNLVNAMRNPQTFEKKKVLTLYTARPKKDRNVYLNATQVPRNIFLTNRLDFAEGFALEYGGERDIWKVRISSQYLMQTMDDKGHRQYQVVGDQFVPVESIELVG